MSAQPCVISPWKRPEPHKPLKMQDLAAFKDHFIDYKISLDIDSPAAPMTLSTIMCTISERCCKTEIVGEMIANGMRIAKFDFCNTPPCDQEELLRRQFIDSCFENNYALPENCCETKITSIMECTQSTPCYQQNLIREFRKCVLEYSKMMGRFYNITIAAELRGPTIQIGTFLCNEDLITLSTGQVCILTTSPAYIDRGTTDRIFVNYYELANYLVPNDIILLDFGRVKFTVRGVVDTDIVCDVVEGGNLAPYSEIQVLNVPLNIGPVTDKDIKDVKIALESEVDVIILPMVRGAFSVEEFKELLGNRCKNVKIFTKIESRQAYDNFDEILGSSDGIIINRGRLNFEMSTERVMVAQKSMVARANKAGKPVYAETEYLNSMILSPVRQSFAEGTDVVNAVLEGIDGIVLINLTSKGDYPAASVKTLAELCRQAEAMVWQNDLFNTLSLLTQPPVDAAHAICISAVEAAMKAHAAGIFVVTKSGKSAISMASYKPRCPIFAMTRSGKVGRILNLYKGILSIYIISEPHSCYSKDIDMRMQEGVDVGKHLGIINPGDPLVMVYSWKPEAGVTNCIRLVYASLDEPWVEPPADQDEVL